MALETLENRKAQTLAGKPDMSPRRQRIISESTGLVKFNIARKVFEEKEQANKEFADLEAEAEGKTLTKKPSRMALGHRSSCLQLSPQRYGNSSRSPTSSSQKDDPVKHTDTSLGLIDDSLMLELASKQREVLELKSNMDAMKKRLSEAEKELHEIERRCNRSTHQPPSATNRAPKVPPKRYQGKSLDQFTSLRSKPSIQTLKASIESTTQQTNNNIQTLKSRMSIPQLKSRTSLMRLSENGFNETLNTNFQKLQKDTGTMIERGISFVNTLKSEMFIKEEEEESDFGESDAESFASDYGSADTSNYQLAVK